MKKYDLFLLLLYILPVITVVYLYSAFEQPRQYAQEKAKTYFDALQNSEIQTVVVRNTNVDLIVVRESRYLGKKLEISGNLSLESTPAFRVSGDTLYIGDQEIDSRFLKLQVADEVKVDTLGAPNIIFTK